MTNLLSAILQKVKQNDTHFLTSLKEALELLIRKTLDAFDIPHKKDSLKTLPKLLKAYTTTSLNRLLPKLTKLPTRNQLEKSFHPDIIQFLSDTLCIKFIEIADSQIPVVTPLAFLLLNAIPKILASRDPSKTPLILTEENHRCWEKTINELLQKILSIEKLPEEKLDPWEVFTILFLLMCGATSQKHALNYRAGTEYALEATNKIGKTFVDALVKASNKKIKISMPKENDIVLGVFRKKLWRLTPKTCGLFKYKTTKSGGYTYYLDIENPDGSINMQKVEYLIRRMKNSTVAPYLKKIFKTLREVYEKERRWLKDAGGKHDPSLLVNLELLIEEEL